mgnify:CR=1 FL=1
MSEEDFTVESLAAFLQWDPAQVMRLADRGKLPGRRVGGQWRFSQADIHHWFEEQIGDSNPAQLQRMEEVLATGVPEHEEGSTSLCDQLPEAAIAAPLLARTRNSVVREMVELAARTGWLWDTDKMIEAVLQREELHPTSLDSGVALLHPRRPQGGILGEAFIALGITPQGIPFGGGRGVLTDIFFLICSTDDRVHLHTLARLSRVIADTDFLQELRAVEGPSEARRLFAARESSLIE